MVVMTTPGWLERETALDRLDRMTAGERALLTGEERAGFCGHIEHRLAELVLELRGLVLELRDRGDPSYPDAAAQLRDMAERMPTDELRRLADL
jgi:hypothetical protein